MFKFFKKKIEIINEQSKDISLSNVGFKALAPTKINLKAFFKIRTR